MRSPVRARMRWFLFSEALILLLALAGPGSRYTLRQGEEHALLARLFLQGPTYLEAVAINFIGLNLFIGGALFIAWLITRLRKQ